MFLRKIKDIRLSNNQISVMRDATISIESLENQISLIQYSPAQGDKDDAVENAKLPPFIQAFYYLFFSYLRIPTETEFWETYLKWVGLNSEGEIEFDNNKYKPNDLKKRANRTYPSLIRDLHFLYLLDTSNKFDQVDYSMERDYYNGLDLKIVHKKKEIYISLFIDTTRGRYFKERKTERHDYSKVYELEFNVHFDSLTKKGAIYLLNHSHIDLLEQKLNETT